MNWLAVSAAKINGGDAEDDEAAVALAVFPDIVESAAEDLFDFDFSDEPQAPAASAMAPSVEPIRTVPSQPRDRTLAGKKRVKARRAGATSPLEALRGIRQVTPDCSTAAYSTAYNESGFAIPEEWALGYLRARLVAPAIASAAVIDPRTGDAEPRYQSGVGALPTPPKGVGKWSPAQQAWAISDKGRRWLLISWTDADANIIGWQLRWEVPRTEPEEFDAKGNPTKVKTHKFDFPADRDETRFQRLVDALHADAEADLVVVIESPVRADSLRSLLPTDLDVSISVLAVGGITMAYEGSSNPSNPSDWLPRLAPAVLALTGGVEGKTAIWCPDADHRYNPNCNAATQKTVESLLDERASAAYVVDVPGEVRHPRTDRVVQLPDGAGLDDLASAMADIAPGMHWLGSLLADSIDGMEYIRLYRSIERNDVQGLAEMLAQRLAERGTHRFLGDGKGNGNYYVYDAGHWSIDHADAAVTIEATGCANRVFGGSKTDTLAARDRARSNIDAAVKRAPKTEVGRAEVITPEAAWEPRTWAEYLPTPSGLLKVETLDLLPHTPEVMNLGVTVVDYVTGAYDENWDRFRRDLFVTEARDAEGNILTNEDGDAIWVHDEEKERMVQEILGAALLGKTFDTGLFLVGAGGSGISTLVGAFVGCLPSAWVGSLSASELCGKENQFVLSSIPFARIAELGEFGPSDMLNDKLWKLIAQDGSQLPIEPKFGAKYQCYPRTTAIATTNHLPGVSAAAGQDNSLPRRACIAKFTRVVKHPDSSLQDRLATTEAREAILAWAVEGANRFLNSKSRKPFRSAESTILVKEWVSDFDRLADFVGTCLKELPSGYVERDEMFKAYIKWCEDNAIEPRWRLDKPKFVKRMERRTGFGSSDSGGNRRNVGSTTQRGWRGWALG